MGDVKGPIVAVAAALFASAFGAPAPAAADSPVDPAAAVQNVKQSADNGTADRTAAAAPAMGQATSLTRGAGGAASPATIHETVERAANRAPAVRRASGDPIRPAVPARPAAVTTAAPRHALAIVRGSLRGSHDRRSAPAAGTRAARTSSPPHGWKATPPARSVPERAVGFRSAPHRTAPVPAPDRLPDGTGTTIGAGGLMVPSAFFFVALLIVALAVSRTLDLRPLRITAPAWRRLVFVAPVVPPG
jgi:hypothetical protein